MDKKGRAGQVDQLVSKRLKMRRIMLGLSQQDLSHAVHVSIQQIQKYEKAKNRISSGKLHAFANFLKVPIHYFFEQNENNSYNSIFVEETREKYKAEDINPNAITDKEIVSIIKAFSEIQNPQSRKKIIELVKTMV